MLNLIEIFNNVIEIISDKSLHNAPLILYNRFFVIILLGEYLPRKNYK